MFSSSSFLTFSSNPVPIRTGSPNFTTVSHSSSLKSSTLALFYALWLNSLKKLCHASSSSVLRNIPLLASKVFFSLTLLVRSTIPILDGSLVSCSSRFFRGDPKGVVAVFAQSSPLKSCSSSNVVPGLKHLFVAPSSGVFPTSISSPASLRVSLMLS